LLSALFASTLALACGVAGPSSADPTGPSLVVGQQPALCQASRADARLGRPGESRGPHGTAAGALLALAPAATGLRAPARLTGARLIDAAAVCSADRPSAQSARGPPA
jgi:hypothetical protein